MNEFTLYQVIDYDQLEPLETGEKLVTGPAKAVVALDGSDRRWWVVGTETYTHPDYTIHLAFVAQNDFQHSDLTDGSMSLDLQLSPDGELITMGWSCDGTPIAGQLTDRNSGGDRVFLPWQVDTVSTCLPKAEKPSYSAVHLCHCKSLPLPELAVA